MRDTPLLAYLGHHKCASSWLVAICKEVCRELGLSWKVVWNVELVDRNLAAYVKNERLAFLCYRNADYRYFEKVEKWRAFHVVRDPRDVCVSAYFSHKNTHPTSEWPELEQHRTRLQSLSKEEGLLADMDFMAGHLEEMRSWPADLEGMLEVRLEELTADPYRGLVEIFRFLDLVDLEDMDWRRRLLFLTSKVCRRLEWLSGGRLTVPFRLRRLPAERLLGVVWENRFERQSGGRPRGREDRGSHYRKGQPGDWRNHFTERHVERFKERHNDLLVRYGYETDEDWS